MSISDFDNDAPDNRPTERWTRIADAARQDERRKIWRACGLEGSPPADDADFVTAILDAGARCVGLELPVVEFAEHMRRRPDLLPAVATEVRLVEVEPTREPEIPIVAYRERESRVEAGVILRHEYRVRSCEDVGEDELARKLGQDWRYYRGNATHVLEERVYRNGEPSTVWTTTSSFDGYERAVEHVDSGVTFVCPVLAQIHADQEAARAAARARKAAEERAAYQAQVEREERERKAARSENAFKRLLASSKDRVWAERWNAFTQGATQDEVKRLRADEVAVRLHDEVLAAETVPTKRRAIKAFFAHVERPS